VVTLVPKDYIERQASLGLILEWVTGDTREIAQDYALDRRTAYLAVAVDAFPKRPILGSGPDTFPKIWIESMETRWFDMEERPAHNTYVEVAIGTGAAGLLAFLGLLAMTYNNYRRAEHTLRTAGDERGAHLIGAYKIAFLAVLIYFFFKSGIDHKYFILALPLSVAAERYAANRIRLIRTHGDTSAPQPGRA
jgi:O-antigen ligase